MDDVRGLNDGLTGYFLEDIFVGQTAVYAKTVTETDVVMFAGISGDTNPVHLNDEYASHDPVQGPYRPWNSDSQLHFHRSRHPACPVRAASI